MNPSIPSFRYKKKIEAYWFFQKKLKKLRIKYINKSGRNDTGSVVIRARGNKNIKYLASVSYCNFKYKGLGIILGIFRQKINTVFIALVKYSTGIILQNALMHGLLPGKYVYTVPVRCNYLYKFFKPGTRILLGFIKQRLVFSQITKIFLENDKARFVRAAGTYTRIFQIHRDLGLATCKLPSGLEVYLALDSWVVLGRNSNIRHKREFLTKAGANVCFGFKSKVRGVAMNPVDHPHGGRTKTNNPEKSPWGWVAKKNK